MRFVAVPCRMPGETGQAFVDRMLRELDAKKGSATALPTPSKIEITATTAKVAKEAKPDARGPRRVRPTADNVAARGADLGTTRSWPPLPGQRYCGAWPPRGMVSPIKRDPPGVTLPLDEGQRAWLERYAAKYPDACNPYTQITLAEAKAREAGQLKVEVG
jgi:hypothetical protein